VGRCRPLLRAERERRAASQAAGLVEVDAPYLVRAEAECEAPAQPAWAGAVSVNELRGLQGLLPVEGEAVAGA
jgi:hypothetical protein